VSVWFIHTVPEVFQRIFGELSEDFLLAMSIPFAAASGEVGPSEAEGPHSASIVVLGVGRDKQKLKGSRRGEEAKNKITVETRQVLVVRKLKNPTRAWCSACAAEAKMVTPDEAATIARTNSRASTAGSKPGRLI
jgi:hypothetical protein